MPKPVSKLVSKDALAPTAPAVSEDPEPFAFREGDYVVLDVHLTPGDRRTRTTSGRPGISNSDHRRAAGLSGRLGPANSEPRARLIFLEA